MIVPTQSRAPSEPSATPRLQGPRNPPRRPLLLLLAVLLLPLGLLAQGAPNTPPYRLNPGDSFDLNFRFTPEFNQTVILQPDGHATLNVAGDFKMAGLTLEELHQAILARASATLVHPEFTIVLKEFDKPHIAVAGEVVTPGRYELRAPTSALQAILLAGGQKDTASMGHIVLFRRVNAEVMEVHKLNFNKVESRKRIPEDIVLQPGDMIFVPRDRLSKLGRYIKTLNLGVYFNPTTIGLP